MKNMIVIFVLVFILSGCGAAGGGGTYRYHFEDPSGKVMDVEVDSVREVGPAKVKFSPDGTVEIEVDSMIPGPNNMLLIPMTLETAAKTFMAVP